MACEQAARIQGSEAATLVKQAQIEVSRNRYTKAISLLETAQVFNEQPHIAHDLAQLKRLAANTRLPK